jgi:hypothetical protein
MNFAKLFFYKRLHLVVIRGQVWTSGRPDERSMSSNPRWKLVVQESFHISSIMGCCPVLLKNYQVLELANGPTAPDNNHQSQKR